MLVRKVTLQICLIVLINAPFLSAQSVNPADNYNSLSFFVGPSFNKVGNTLSFETVYHSNFKLNVFKLLNEFQISYDVSFITWGKSVDNIDFRDYAVYFVPQYTAFNGNKIQLKIGGGLIVHLLNTKLNNSTNNTSKNSDLKLGFAFSGYARYNVHKYFDLAFKTRFQIVKKLNAFELLFGITSKIPTNLTNLLTI
ncbi:hypothetical protein IIC38_11570 [candidate division KSB1 bacterium]|nr:hypothetical protein [candidate division KSB1 bacterium]